jgi:hypothetical protein
MEEDDINSGVLRSNLKKNSNGQLNKKRGKYQKYTQKTKETAI